MLLLKEKNNAEDLSATVLRNNLLDEYSGENTHGKVMPAHRIFKESAKEDLEFQQKEDRLRRIHTTIANASFEHIEPHVFTSENTPSSIEETKTDVNSEAAAIYYIRFQKTLYVFNEIIEIMGYADDINICILGNTLNIKYSNDISTSTTLFNINKNDEEYIHTILESVVSILDTATDMKIFSSILNKIK